MENNHTERRKAQHIEICLHEPVEGVGITTGLERYRFVHRALPEIDFADISTESSFLSKPLRVPFLISSMTGGTERAQTINRRLAEAAERRGLAIGLGSLRAAVEDERLASSFRIRPYAPDALILANLGAVQLNYGFGTEHCRKAVDICEADGLVLHLNSLQEVFQPEGNTNFDGLLRRIEELCRQADFPVGAKEVGWGIDGRTARKLLDAGVAFIDTAGAGGTSWSQVEKFRLPDGPLRRAAETFAEWGNPTAECILNVREVSPKAPLIASGGIRNGLEAAKCLKLGADLVGFGRSLLASAVDSDERIDALFEQLETELKIAMFGTGSRSISEFVENAEML